MVLFKSWVHVWWLKNIPCFGLQECLCFMYCDHMWFTHLICIQKFQIFNLPGNWQSWLPLDPCRPLPFGSTFLPNLKSYRLIVLTCAAKETFISQPRLNLFIPNDILFNENYWLFNSCVCRRWWKSGAHGSDSRLPCWSFKAAWDARCIQRYCSEVKGTHLCYCMSDCYYLSIYWVSNWMQSLPIVSTLVACSI